MNLQNLIVKLYVYLRHEHGQGLAEYVLIIFLFAIAMVAAFTNFSSALGNLYTTIRTAFP